MNIKLFFLVCFLFIIGCVDSQYSGYPSYPNQYPPTYPNNYPYGTTYPNQGYPYPYPPPPPQNNYPYRYPNRYPNHDRHDHHHGRDNNNKPPVIINRPPAAQFPRHDNTIKPSCPSGTRYDGRSCIITDNRLKKPGGDGRINPCPKGMWNSGGKCVPG